MFTVYTYTPELFPTVSFFVAASCLDFSKNLFCQVVRGTAMGACSMLARVGAIAASYIAMW